MALFSNAAFLSGVGIVILSVTLIIVAVWVAVLSVQVSRLKKLLVMMPPEGRKVAGVAGAAAGAAAGRVAAGVGAGAAAGAGAGVMQPLRAEVSEEAARRETNSPRQAKAKKGKPTIPFGTNREAQARANRVYTDMIDDVEYDPDSIDFTRVEGLKDKLSSMPASAQGRTPSGSEGAAVGAAKAEPVPRQRGNSRPLKSASGRIPSENARKATAETRASFNRVSQDLQRRSVAAGERRQRLSERRHSEQLHRKADSIRQQLQ